MRDLIPTSKQPPRAYMPPGVGLAFAVIAGAIFWGTIAVLIWLF